MKKIFILTGEPSGDKLASTVISKLKSQNSNIEYLSVGGQHLNSIGIKSIYDQKDITYIAFTDILLLIIITLPVAIIILLFLSTSRLSLVNSTSVLSF